jgi:hypothetical protein
MLQGRLEAEGVSRYRHASWSRRTCGLSRPPSTWPAICATAPERPTLCHATPTQSARVAILTAVTLAISVSATASVAARALTVQQTTHGSLDVQTQPTRMLYARIIATNGRVCDKRRAILTSADCAIAANHQLAFQCQEPDTWCCHEGNDTPLIERINTTNTRCCGYPTLVFKAPWSTVVATATGTPLPIATLMSSARFLTTSTATSTSTSTSTASPNTSQPSTPALGIGLGVGLGGGAIIALAIGLFFLRRRKKRQAGRGPIPGGYVVEKEGDGQWPAMDKKTGMDGKGRSELQDAEVSAELRGNEYIAELPAK